MALFLVVGAFAPIIGAVVRYRLSYHPTKLEESRRVESVLFDSYVGADKALSVQEKDRPSEVYLQEASAPAETNPTPLDIPPTFTSVLKSVWAAEKFEGLFKGTVPTVIFVWCFGRGFVSPAPAHADFYLGYIYLILNILYVPFLTIAYRAIATPLNLSTSQVKRNIQLLLTPAELASLSIVSHIPFLRGRVRIPFIHCFNLTLPTALPPYLISFIIGAFLTGPSMLPRYIGIIGPLLDHYDDESPWEVFSHPRWSEWAKVGMYLAAAILGTILQCPLDVITTRLAVQRWDGKEEAEKVVHERDVDVESLTREEARKVQRADGLRLTCDEVKYKNTWDGFRRITKEEGWGVLYRCWWLTFLGNFFYFLR